MKRIQPKLTPLELFIDLFLDYTLQKGLIMLLLLVFCFRAGENIVAKDYNEPVNKIFEDTLR